jgi:hypothetical protein
VKVEEEEKTEDEERSSGAFEEDRTSEIYTPPGWAETAPEFGEEPEPDYTDAMFAVTSDEFRGAQSEEAELFDELFAPGKAKKASIRKAPSKPVLEDIDIDVDLPEGAMPEIEADEDWEDVEDWGEEEEEDEWEELDELEDEDWEEEEEEDEWEEITEEEVEEVLVVTCKCGEEIEIPSSFKGSKFRCPSCGRTGKLRR